jgi:hypothetical protein
MFIEQLTDQIIGKVETVLKTTSYLEKLLRTNSRIQSQAEDLALQILSLSQVGRPVPGFGEPVTVDHRTETKKKRNMGGSATVNLGLGPRPQFGAEVKASGRSEEDSERTTIEKGTAPSVPRFFEVRQKLVKLLDLLQIDRLIILIDEWSAIDPTASTAIQPEFGELLKRTFGGTPHISVKIASAQLQTRLNNRQSGRQFRGLELNADIFEAIDLDKTLRKWGKDSFYDALLFKRLVFCEPDLKMLDPNGDGVPLPAFLESIFQTKYGFEQVLKAAEGIPRDVLAIFNGLSRLKNFSVEPLWEVRELLPYIRERGVEKLRDAVPYQSEADQVLTNCIKRLVKRTDSRIFFVSINSFPSIQGAIEELIEKRLIHHLPVMNLADSMRDEYQGYVLDFGLWLDWSNWNASKNMLGEVPQFQDPGKVKGLVLDLSLLENQNTKICLNCSSWFPKDARSYVVRGLCPSCFMPADERPVAVQIAESDQMPLQGQPATSFPVRTATLQRQR